MDAQAECIRLSNVIDLGVGMGMALLGNRTARPPMQLL
ncbi:hypothetical protein PRIPAC_89529 [Pristionchus pacificus]|uniref:Uncharacterized protein n=1 Tax=Pristionchus pacificus TaxID=54126 RepID=A0A2A6CVQ2_PRIPA|nr:hypothetical protein PRIPAC_89529 [Pristionchus pacificus]|eukprot:PDM82156.1 hypothetical protein PRIPAC_36549 [Pristionchus pacificus]